MARPATPQLPPTTGEGNVINESFRLSNAALISALDYTELVERKVDAINRQALAAGTFLGSGPIGFVYPTVDPTDLPSRDSKSIAGLGVDTDGKTASSVLIPGQRTVEVTWESNGTGGSTNLRSTVYDIAANGVQTQVATGLHNGQLVDGLAIGSYVIVGVQAVAANIWKTELWVFGTGAGKHMYVQWTATLDTATNTISFVVDFSPSFLSGSNPVLTGTMHRRKAWLVGQFGAFFPRIFAMLGWFGGTYTVMGGCLVERATGSNFCVNKMLAGPTSAAPSVAIDRLSDGLFAVLSDGYATGTGSVLGAGVTVGTLDDLASGSGAVARIGNLLAGNARLTALNGREMVVGYTTGTQFATYLVRLDEDGGVRLKGAMSTTGALGIVPIEHVPLPNGRFAVFTKGSGTAVTVSIYSYDVNAASGVSPFTLVRTFSIAVGQGVAGGVAGDATVIGEIKPLWGNLVRISGRNTTRSLNFHEVREWTGAAL